MRALTDKIQGFDECETDNQADWANIYGAHVGNDDKLLRSLETLETKSIDCYSCRPNTAAYMTVSGTKRAPTYQDFKKSGIVI